MCVCAVFFVVDSTALIHYASPSSVYRFPSHALFSLFSDVPVRVFNRMAGKGGGGGGDGDGDVGGGICDIKRVNTHYMRTQHTIRYIRTYVHMYVLYNIYNMYT